MTASTPILSVVVPAYNEEKRLGQTLRHTRDVLAKVGFTDFEMIVADDASTDHTAEVAKRCGAVVVFSGRRNIGATRNVGARAARGCYLLFLDADTTFGEKTAAALRKAIANKKAVGGGAVIRWSEPVPWHAAVGVRIWNFVSRVKKWPCGAFFFVRRDLFEKVGGFDESYLVSEEIHLARSLQNHGSLVIFPEGIESSPRKFHQYTLKEIGRFFFHFFRSPRKTLQSREYLDFWYTRRE